jgi:hypothetical protein
VEEYTRSLSNGGSVILVHWIGPTDYGPSDGMAGPVVGVGAKDTRRTLIAIRTFRDLVGTSSEHRPKKRLTRMLVKAAHSGTQNSASETHFRVRRPRPIVPAE